MSVFCFIDRISELKRNESVTAYYTLRGSEEFLKDHFDSFPVMPGVLLLEAMKQAALSLMAASQGAEGPGFRLVAVDDAKFGQFVKPGNQLKLFVRFLKSEGALNFLEGRADLVESSNGVAPSGKAISAKFTLVRMR